MSTVRPFQAASAPAAGSSVDAAPAPRRARIFLLSDVRLYREGLLWSLSRQQAFEVLGAGDLSTPTMAYVVDLTPDVVILDVGVTAGFAAAKTLSSRLPSAKIIAFAVSEVDHVVLACAEAGIAGYVAPDGSEEDLVNAVQFALRGELYCSPRIAGLLFRRINVLSARLAGSGEPDTLTQRERQILDLVGEGMSNKEIGRVASPRRGGGAVAHRAGAAASYRRRRPSPGGEPPKVAHANRARLKCCSRQPHCAQSPRLSEPHHLPDRTI